MLLSRWSFVITHETATVNDLVKSLRHTYKFWDWQSLVKKESINCTQTAEQEQAERRRGQLPVKLNKATESPDPGDGTHAGKEKSSSVFQSHLTDSKKTTSSHV